MIRSFTPVVSKQWKHSIVDGCCSVGRVPMGSRWNLQMSQQTFCPGELVVKFSPGPAGLGLGKSCRLSFNIRCISGHPGGSERTTGSIKSKAKKESLCPPDPNSCPLLIVPTPYRRFHSAYPVQRQATLLSSVLSANHRTTEQLPLESCYYPHAISAAHKPVPNPD